MPTFRTENDLKRLSELTKEKRAHLNNIKRLQGCARCGYDAHAEALDFNHLPGEKKLGNISEMVSNQAGWEKLMTEVLKCEVLCSNCHRVHTHSRAA